MRSRGRHVFTSESVTEGHPDKIADQISDAVLDAVLARDPVARVACETMVTTGLVVVSGEITAGHAVDIPRVVRQTIREVGYTRAKYGFDADTCAVLTSIDEQSGDIKMGVDTGGAGDQGLMFGFACDETDSLLPMPIYLAHQLVMGLSRCRREGRLDYLRPDGKSQVTVEYDGSRPVRVDAVVVSTQHAPEVGAEKIREDVIEQIIRPTIPEGMLDQRTRISRIRRDDSSPAGRRGIAGSPDARSSWTPMAACPGTEAAPFPARTRPRSTARPRTWRGTSPRTSWPPAWRRGPRCSSPTPSAWPSRCRSWSTPSAAVRPPRSASRPPCARSSIYDEGGIIETLDLRRPIFRQTAAFGHFGRAEKDFTWERTDRARLMAEAVERSQVGSGAEKRR